MHADISADELRWHLVRFLDLPATAESVGMPLPLLTLLRSGICGIQPDSVRVRYFVLLSSYAEMVEHPHGKGPPHVKRRRVVIVDAFPGNWTVLGAELTHQKWYLEGCKTPWHLSMKANIVANKREPKLKSVAAGMAEGFFPWRPDGDGLWVGNEAPHLKALSQRNSNNAGRSGELSQDLLSTVRVAKDLTQAEKTEAVKALLAAGANVNHPPEALNGFTPLHAALVTSDVEVAKLLMVSHADVEAICTMSAGEDNTSFNYCSSKEIWTWQRDSILAASSRKTMI